MDAWCGTGKVGVNEGEAIILLDEETVHHAEASESKKRLSFSNKFHKLTLEKSVGLNFA